MSISKDLIKSFILDSRNDMKQYATCELNRRHLFIIANHSKYSHHFPVIGKIEQKHDNHAIRK